MSQNNEYIPEFLYNWLKPALTGNTSGSFDLTKQAAAKTESESLKKIGFSRGAIGQILPNLPKESLSVTAYGFLQAILNPKVNIGEEIKKCNQSDLGELKKVILRHMKQEKSSNSIQQLKIILDFIEANNFIRFVTE